MSQPRYSFRDLKPDTGSFASEVIAGLSQPQKALSPKYFYDERGSALFERICELPEYYPTRTEMALMHAHGREMASLLGPDCLLVEYGSGSGQKTLQLIEQLQPAAYMPIDISGAQLRNFAASLTARFPHLRVAAVCADYTQDFALPDVAGVRAGRRAAYFPGSTIGNFTIDEARDFLRRAARMVMPGGAMLIGVDLKKAEALLNAAYNDAQGVTADFNLNLLARINRELDANFDLAAFRHHAFYNARAGRIEMHLVSMKDQSVSVAGRSFVFGRNETIHTENSYKYSIDEFAQLAGEAGFRAERCWVDRDSFFSVHYLVAQTKPVPGSR
jgi:dimethylhistidine N-methyltransferase